jgi:hypothetical protein
MGVGAEPIISDEVAFHALAGDENTTACSKILFGKLKNTISWYPKCLENQFKGVPTWLTDCIPSSLSEIFKEVALQAAPGTSIEDLASYLLRWELVKSRKDIGERLAARSIVFAILGWQTMLFQPALGTCPLQQIAVADVMDGYNGQFFMKLKQDHSTIKRPLSDFLLGFGLMLPKENTCISEDTDDCQAYEKVDIVRPEEINVSLLHRFARIDIEWVDVIAPHLEFDKATNKLYLFKHPSFCMANLLLLEESGIRSMIYK